MHANIMDLLFCCKLINGYQCFSGRRKREENSRENPQSYQHGPIIIVIEFATFKVKDILFQGLAILRWLFLQRFEVADLLSS